MSPARGLPVPADRDRRAADRQAADRRSAHGAQRPREPGLSGRSRNHPTSAAVAPPAARLLGLPPVIARHTRLIVLGSFPGAASLAALQYYAHPRNQFWPILSALWGLDLRALPYTQRLAELRRRGLGLWDVYASCQRAGSLDSAIEDAVPNDLASLRRRAPGLRAVAHNGGESARSMKVTAALDVPVHRLPSTSPANASWSFERKCSAWHAVFLSAGLL